METWRRYGENHIIQLVVFSRDSRLEMKTRDNKNERTDAGKKAKWEGKKEMENYTIQALP